MYLFLPTGILVAFGLLAVASGAATLFYSQVLWVAIGICIFASFYFFDWRILLSYRWFSGLLYSSAILLLLTAYFFSPAIKGAARWVFFGPFSFQPSELAKAALILLYAGYFSKRHLKIASWGVVAKSFIIFAVPAALVAFQPDLGSSIVLLGIWFGFLLFSGLPGKRLITLLAVFFISAVFFWFYFMADYQRDRITGIFFPERDALGVNYGVIQSKIAIGSTDFWGKGFRQGTQVRLGFLTEPAADFVLAAIIEEWGIFGGMLAISAFLWLIGAIVRIGIYAERNFEKFICLGTVTVFGLQFLVNGGSALGLTPVTGITLPFVSYGGSSMVISFFLLGIVNAIRRKQT